MVRRILVPYDGSLHSQCALVEAAARAARDDAATTLLAVAADPRPVPGLTAALRADAHADACRRLHALLNQARAEFGASQAVETVVRCGDPAHEILDMIATGRFDLVVMGAQSRGRFHSMREGSVAREVRWHSRVPVVLAPAVPWRERHRARQPVQPRLIGTKPSVFA